MPGDNQPTVSVITATYNRSNVLRFAIESLRGQTFTDWEMIVAGDACTDDTETVVRSFADARIQFFNRPVNSGDQATPNNDGVSRARGKYIAFLNHDDLWRRDHLVTAVEAIERLRADVVWTVAVIIGPAGEPDVTDPSLHVYSPDLFIPASSWLMRREVAERVGPWRPAREIFIAPSQEWLFRAWRAGCVLRRVDVPTVLMVASGPRRNSYAERQYEDQAAYAAKLADPRILDSLYAQVCSQKPAAVTVRPGVLQRLRRVMGNTIRQGLVAAGLHPHTLYYVVKFRRPGGYLDSLRKTRGLPPLPRHGGSS